MPLLKSVQARFLGLLAALWLGVFFVTRSTLLLMTHLSEAQLSLGDVLRLYGEGVIYDVSFLLYALAPLALYLLLCPGWLWRKRWHLRVLQVAMTIGVFLMLFTAVAEWLFWDEFGVRFNFIAVDYLVYSDEVINNILESYPVYPLLAALTVIAVITTALLQPRVRRIGRSAAELAPAWRQPGWRRDHDHLEHCHHWPELPAQPGR